MPFADYFQDNISGEPESDAWGPVRTSLSMLCASPAARPTPWLPSSLGCRPNYGLSPVFISVFAILCCRVPLSARATGTLPVHQTCFCRHCGCYNDGNSTYQQSLLIVTRKHEFCMSGKVLIHPVDRGCLLLMPRSWLRW